MNFEDPTGYEAQEKQKREKLQALSPSAHTVLQECMTNPAMSKDEFFRKVDNYNNVRTNQAPREGAYETIMEHISPTRTIKINMFKNGRVDIRGNDDS